MKGKGNSKKTYKKGDQCVQNPGTRRHRDVVKRNVISQRKSGGGKNHLSNFLSVYSLIDVNQTNYLVTIQNTFYCRCVTSILKSRVVKRMLQVKLCLSFGINSYDPYYFQYSPGLVCSKKYWIKF